MKQLERRKYAEIAKFLSPVSINKLFAYSVANDCVSGIVYVDNEDTPNTFYIVHPYGMSLLLGDCNNKEFNAAFREYALNTNKVREKHEWMQVFPGNWNSVLNELFKDCMIKSSDNVANKEDGIIELNTRVNFKFNRSKFQSFRNKSNIDDFKIVRTDKQIFQDMKGSVVPYYFWRNAEDFYEKGVGFSLFHENKLASTAYSAFIHDDKLELGIETVEEFRGKGFAQHTCTALIDYCIENNYEPVWACRLENIGSYNLAQKLGFEPSDKIPYYRLSK